MGGQLEGGLWANCWHTGGTMHTTTHCDCGAHAHTTTVAGAVATTLVIMPVEAPWLLIIQRDRPPAP